jgi:endonuclease YncB( thermonuclease family)
LTLFWTILSPLTMGVTNAQSRFSGKVLGVDAGDTIRVQLTTLVMTVRLHGVECPDTPEALFEKAKAFTAQRVAHKVVVVEVRGTGPKQTVYGEVYPESGGSLNRELIRLGLATWARAYAPDRNDLERLEQEARERKQGLWGDPSGKDIALPSPEEESTPTPSPTPSPSPTSEPTSAPTASAVLLPSLPTMPPAATVATPPRTSPPVASSAEIGPLPSVPLVMGITFLLFTIGMAVALRVAPGGQEGSLLAQVLLGALGGLGVSLVCPIFLELLFGKIPLDAPALLTLLFLPLIALSLLMATRFYGKEQRLRSIPTFDIAQLPEGGLVRISGRTSAPQGVIYSDVGRIPGIYVQEKSFRYQVDTRNPAHPLRWYPRHHRLNAADFLLTDETGSIFVETSKATFHALRVARFYNDIPVERFFEQSYSGDLRSEVFFIPAEANVTVWGRCFTTASPFAGTAEKRIGLDLLSDTLIVVEEKPSRIFTHRPLFGLFLMLVAALLAFVVILCLVTPDTITRLLPGAGS